MVRCGLIGVALVAIGCGKSVAPEFVTLTEAVRSEVAAHRGTADAQPDQGACTAERVRYRDAVAAKLDRMAALSGAMDGCLGMRAGSFASHCSSMQSEVSLHVSTPCGADAAANAGELRRHCDQMERLLDEEASWMSCPMMGGQRSCASMMDVESICTGGCGGCCGSGGGGD